MPGSNAPQEVIYADVFADAQSQGDHAKLASGWRLGHFEIDLVALDQKVEDQLPQRLVSNFFTPSEAAGDSNKCFVGKARLSLQISWERRGQRTAELRRETKELRSQLWCFKISGAASWAILCSERDIMKYIGAFLIFAILVNADPGKIFLTQVCHSGRRSLRLWRLALLNISDEDCEILATTANLQVHEMLRTTSNLTAGQMSQLRRIHDLFFEGMSGRCQAWLGGFQLRSGECLALHILIGGQDMLGLNRSQWRQDDDSDYDSSYNVEVFPGKFMKWYPTQHLRSVVRSSRKWHFESHKELRCQLWTSPGRSHRPRRKANQSYERFNPTVPGIPLKMLPSKHPLTTSWFRKEPTALSCNSSNYDWRWSHLRRELWLFHRKENLRTLPLVPIELLEFIAPLYDPQGMARFNLEETTKVAGEGLSLDTEREFTGIFTDICVLGQVSVMFLAVLAHYQVGQPSLHLLKYLYISVFLKGLWVLLDGSLWPITAVDVVKLHEQHRTEAPKRTWQLCPCGRISSPQVPTQPKKHVQNVALIGGHNYAFDIALGLHDASVALSSPLTMNLLGYAFAEKYAAAAEYCQLMEGNFCVRDVEMQNLLKQLSDSNCGLQKHCANLVKSLSVAQGTNHTWVNNPTFDLATAREETRRVYLQSIYLQRADFIICTHPYLLAYLLDEAAWLKIHPFTLLPMNPMKIRGSRAPATGISVLARRIFARVPTSGSSCMGSDKIGRVANQDLICDELSGPLLVEEDSGPCDLLALWSSTLSKGFAEATGSNLQRAEVQTDPAAQDAIHLARKRACSAAAAHRTSFCTRPEDDWP
eukprot:symbB.v1.2.014776.t1/scaffold1059.1/size140537/4